MKESAGESRHYCRTISVAHADRLPNERLLGLDHKVIAQTNTAEIAGFLDDLQRLGPKDPVVVGFEECAHAAPAQAKSRISLIHLCFLL